jgi:hypothetical protein
MRRNLTAPSVVLAISLYPCAGFSGDFSYDDCILNGLKGVASDTAAVMVRHACESKKLEHHRALEARLEAAHGAELTYDELKLLAVKDWSSSSSRFFETRIANQSGSSGLTLTYVRLQVSSVRDGYCHQSRGYSYSLRLAPGDAAVLQFPAVDGPPPERLCIDVAYGRGRTATWTDKASGLISGRVEPLQKDLFADRPDPSPPAPPPVAAPAAAPAPAKPDYSSLIVAPDNWKVPPKGKR